MPQLLVESRPVIMTLTEAAGGKLIASGEFGRADVPTQNGRRYPRKIYEREIGKLHEDIQNRRTFGELDHPCLTSDDFRVLTSDGWRAFRDVKVGDRVWSRKDGQAVLSTVTGITDAPYDGPAYRVSGRSMDATFTPGHRFLLVKRPDRSHSTEEFVTIAEIAEHPERYAHHAIPKTATFFSENTSQVAIPGVEAKRLASCKSDVSQPLMLDAGLFAAFMGIYLAEGHCSADSVDNYDVCISQKTGWSKKFIHDEVLAKFPAGLEWREIETGYALADQRLHAYLKLLGDAYTKRIPVEAKRLDADSLKELLFWFCIGDGRMVASGAEKRAEMALDGVTTKELMAAVLRSGTVPFTRQDAFSVSEELVRDLHECLVLSGGAGSITRIDPKNDYEFAGRTILAANKVPLYQLHICQSKNVWMDPRHLAIETVQHQGNIYCLTTTVGSFYMEQNGQAFWTGNSDGKTKLQRVSHVITALVLEDDGRVVGTAEILPTPNGQTLAALLRSGVAIGVSSRGFGSTRPADDGDGEVVAEDFCLKTFDFVADPAMKTAYPEVRTEDLDGMFDLEAMRTEMPDLVAALEESLIGQAEERAKKKLEAAQADAFAKVEARVRTEERQVFERTLLTQLAEVRETVAEELREEFASDPLNGAAAGVLAQIAELTAPFWQKPDEQTVAAALREKDIVIAGLKESLDQFVGIAKTATYKLRIEQRLGGHPHVDLARSLLADVGTLESVSALDARLDAIVDELGDVPEKRDERDAKIEEMQVARTRLLKENESLHQKLAAMTLKVEKLDESFAKLDAQRLDAEKQAKEMRVSLAESQLTSYKAKAVAGYVNGRSMMQMLENAGSTAEVDRLVREHGRMVVADSQLERARQTVQRSAGESTLLSESVPREGVTESTENPFAEFGIDVGEVQRLAGLNG